MDKNSTLLYMINNLESPGEDFFLLDDLFAPDNNDYQEIRTYLDEHEQEVDPVIVKNLLDIVRLQGA